MARPHEWELSGRCRYCESVQGSPTSTGPCLTLHKYPEHARLHKVADKSWAVGEFIEQSGYVLCVHHSHTEDCQPISRRGQGSCGIMEGALFPVMEPLTVILSKYYNIDLTRIDNEKKAMLDKIRAEHQERMVGAQPDGEPRDSNDTAGADEVKIT